MVDQSERAFRLLTRRHGVTLAYTPMIHAEPFVADAAYRQQYFDAWERASDMGRADADRPLIAQLGGDDPRTMLRAAQLLEPYVDAVDVNMGCPTMDAKKGGHTSHSPRCRRYGAYLLTDLHLVQRIVSTLAHSLQRVPVTVKMRLLEHDGATIETACAIEQAGAVALCVHGRTARQGQNKKNKNASDLAARWDSVAAVRLAVGIPVISNGGIETMEDALSCLRHTGAAAVMSAEALLENPDLFSGVAASWPSEADRMVSLARNFLELAQAHPSTLKYPPTKSHLFKMLHRLLGADQAEARRRDNAGLPLALREELKLELMRCPVADFKAVSAALDTIEACYARSPQPSLGPSWYRRWRKPGGVEGMGAIPAEA